MKTVTIRYNGSSLNAHVPLPASKSISNRLLILRALSGYEFAIENLSTAGDTRVLHNCLEEVTKGGHPILNVEDAGTAARFLTAWLAYRGFPCVLTGSPSLQKRPIGQLVDALRQLGAQIRYAGNAGFLPLEFGYSQLKGGMATISAGTSSQFVSALLMIGPGLPGGLQLELKGEEVSRPYTMMTLKLMERMGAKTWRKGNRIGVAQGLYINPVSFSVEADWSASAPWYSLAALAPGSSFLLEGLNSDSIQGDRCVGEIFRHMGVITSPTEKGVIVSATQPSASSMDFNFMHCPDLAQSAIVAAAALGCRAKFTGLQTLRFKETDRFRALLTQMGRLGFFAEYADNKYIELPGEVPFLKQLPVQTYNDHRMAMAFAPLVLKTGELVIEEPEVVAKSYPDFWQHLEAAGLHVAFSV